jgi:hypothetical protein
MHGLFSFLFPHGLWIICSATWTYPNGSLFGFGISADIHVKKEVLQLGKEGWGRSNRWVLGMSCWWCRMVRMLSFILGSYQLLNIVEYSS